MATFVTAKYEIKFSFFREKEDLNDQTLEELEQQAEDFDDYLQAIDFSGLLSGLVERRLLAGGWDKKVFFQVERKG